jgi:hypothetical protein
VFSNLAQVEQAEHALERMKPPAAARGVGWCAALVLHACESALDNVMWREVTRIRIDLANLGWRRSATLAAISR